MRSLDPGTRSWLRERPSCGGFFDADAKQQELAKIEEETGKPDFWNDQERAQKALRRRRHLETAIEK